MSTAAVARQRTQVALRHRVLPSSMLMRELLVSVSRPRALAIKTVAPLVIVVPLLAGHAPTFWAAMLLTVLVAMIGAVGSALTIARARESGLLTRLSLTPRPPWRVVTSWVTGAVVIDALQLVPALAVLFLLAPGSPKSGAALVCMVVATLVVANTLGAIVSLLGGGPGEVLLDVVILLAPLLFLGGLFTGVAREGWRWLAALADPFTYAHSAFIAALGGTPVFGLRSILLAAGVTVVASGMLLVVLARPILRRR